MKKTVRASVAQMAVKGMDAEANLAHMCDLIDRAAGEQHTELVVFPELANSGYVKLGDLTFSKEYIRCAEMVPGPFTDGLGERARRHGVYVVAGMLEAHPQIPYTVYNSVVLIGPTGSLIGVQRKIHLPVAERALFHPGNSPKVFPTELGNMAIQVCADSSLPEISRIFALKGAEIICTSYNVLVRPGKPFFEERIHHIAVCRALEDMVFFIGCNRVGSDASGSFVGHSCIAGPSGQTLACSNSDQEEILTAVLEEEDLLEARASYSYLRDPKPQVCKLLTELLPS